MGTWNTKINGNDTFQDIYQSFFDSYNQGQKPADISKQIYEEFADSFNDSDDRNNCLFGLALAQWETKSLDSETLRQVKEIITSGNDLEVWKGLGAAEKTLKQRQIVLDKFLAQISADREKPKRRIRPKFDFEVIELVNITSPDNLKTFRISEEYSNKNYIHTSGIMMWSQGGGSVLYFTGLGMTISAKWLDSNTLEVTHDKNIIFEKQDDSSYFCGDKVKVIYKAK
jgi:hypothetical protein